MLITDFTTFDEIRATLGVSEDELEDSVLGLPLYADALEIELEDIHINLQSLYAAKRDLTSPSEDEVKFIQAVHLFATYAVARELTTALPLFSPEQITDGKSALRRPQDSPHKKVTENVNRQYARFRSRLDQTFAVVNSSGASAAVQKTYLGVIAPASNPITGT